MKTGLLLSFAFVSMLLACSTRSNLVERTDIENYLHSTLKSPLVKIDSEINFWNQRFTKVPDDLIARAKIASLLIHRFAYSGNIAEIHEADSLYKLVNSINRLNSSSTYRSLAANCITQHQFRLAQSYIDSALALGDDKFLSTLMEFDIALELGNLQRARKSLGSIHDKNCFEYLIRQAKYKDKVEGDLESAISLMEMAREKSKEIPNKELFLWVNSNLADMYGHANRFEDSYQKYLQVLQEDPQYYHALKGIAWLAYAKDNNLDLAKEILVYLKTVHPIPDYDLLLANIAETENDSVSKKQLLHSFDKRVTNYLYGNMYNKYLFNLHAEEWQNKTEALEIAQKEIELRPTCEAFSWLAWAYLINNQKEKALQTVKYHVENKSFEPESLFLLGKIYFATGNTEKAKQYLTLAKESAFELGPNTLNQINQYLAKL